MAYNHGREDRKWRIWKEAEEKLLRECGVDEATIEQIRMADRADFNSNRRFYRWTNDVAEYLEDMAGRERQAEVGTVAELLEEIESENLYALQIGTDSEGGYLVPDEYERTLVEALEEENIFRQFAKVIQTSSGDRKIPVVASKGTASWIDEEGAYTESDDSFAQVSIGAYKLGTMIKVSEELLNDSVFDLESYIAREFARRIGTKEEEAFFTGDGTGKPLGILAASGGAETGVTAASATAVTADELMDLFYSLKSPYRKNAVWILNDSTIKAIRKLKDNNGQYLWQPSLVAGTPDTILGRPVKTSAYMPAIAAGAKTIAFGDFSYYWIADRQGRSFKRLNELYAANGQVGFLGSQRVDCKMILPEAVKVLVQKAGSAG